MENLDLFNNNRLNPDVLREKVIDNEEIMHIKFEISKRQRDCGCVDQTFKSRNFGGVLE